MKQFYNILKITSWCIIGLFAGSSLYQYYDYKKHPDLYAMTSAPWYLSIQITGCAAAIILAVLFIIMWGIKKENKDPPQVITFQMTASQNHVSDFLEKLGSQPKDYDNDKCYNITPQEITDQYGFEVFKFDKSCAGYLFWNDKIYPLGSWLGGYGVVSFAVGDLNMDEAEELYFTFSWGSGRHRSMAGYFDSALEEVALFEYSYFDNDMMFATDGSKLELRHAQIDGDSHVDLSVEAGDRLGEILSDSGEIQIHLSR